MNEKLDAFVKAYGTRGASLILRQAAMIANGDYKPKAEVAKEVAAEVIEIAALLQAIAEEHDSKRA